MSSRSTPPRPPPPPPAPDWALFLDVDGCLLDLAGAPDAVVMPRTLPAVLTSLSQRLDGAVALISGRALANVEELFIPLQLPVAGLHGLERRSVDGAAPMLPTPPTWDVVREAAASVVADHPGTLLEDKGAALALHWRNAPQAASELLAFAESTLPRLPGYRLQHGDHVVELRPAAGDKGTAVVALLDEPPFRGRVPVFVGDDVTDEAGFAVVNARGGLSVVVGDREPSCAHYALRDPTAVRAWLAGQHPTEDR